MATIKDFNFQHWWTLLAAAGTLIASASIPVSFIPGFLIGLSLLSFGIGEWINHPQQMKKETVKGMLGFRMVQANPWKFNFFGVGLDALGLGLLGFALYRLIVSTS